MDAMRWILLLLGILVIAGVYGYYRWQDYLPGRIRRGRIRRDDDVDLALKDLDDLVIGDPDRDDLEMDVDVPLDTHEPSTAWDDPEQSVSAPRVRSTTESRDSGRTTAEEGLFPVSREADTLDPDPAWQDAGEKIVVLHVTAGRGYVFTGPPLQEALERVGLRHGMHDIYHYVVDAHSGPTPMFSVASMVEPGHFDLQSIEELETPGVALFMQLPGPFDGLTAFEQMLEVARRLADRLDGHLLDGKRCELTAQAVEHIREDLREYRRKAHLLARRGRA